MAAMRIALQRLLDDQREARRSLCACRCGPSPATPERPPGSGSSPRQGLDHAGERGCVHVRANDNPLAADERDLHPAGSRRRQPALGPGGDVERRATFTGKSSNRLGGPLQDAPRTFVVAK